MKLKGLTKLALSGVALAAVAATLGTSTYAWYISNTTASVSGAEGSTAQADTSGSLYAAGYTMHEASKWGNKVSLNGGSEKDATHDYISVANLTPVTKATADATTAYNAKVAAADAVNPTPGSFVDKAGAAVTAANGAYLEFEVWLIQRGTKVRQVAPKLTITNETSADTIAASKQTAYSSNNLPGSGLAAGSAFKVDAVHALRVEIENTTGYASKKAADAYTADDLVGTKVFAADTAFETYSTKSGMVTGGSANGYYNSVVDGVNLYGCGAGSAGNLCADVVAPSGTWGNFYLKPETETKLTFRIWLEGTDAQCFDSCVAQSFKFALEFDLLPEA